MLKLRRPLGQASLFTNPTGAAASRMSSGTQAGCLPGWTSSVTRPVSSLCPAGQTLNIRILPDETYCYQCTGGAAAFSAAPVSCPPGFIQSTGNDTCPAGQTPQNVIYVPGGNGKTYCYQCLPDPNAAYAAQQAAQAQAQAAQAQSQTDAANNAAANNTTTPPPDNSGGAPVYPAGLTPPPQVAWKGLGEIVLALAVGAFILNKFGGGKKAGPKKPAIHHVEKKETFDVEA